MTTSTHSHKPWTDKGGHVMTTDQIAVMAAAGAIPGLAPGCDPLLH